MEDGSTARWGGKWLLRVTIALLALHFVFAWLLALGVSVLAVLAFLAAILLATPLAARVPGIGSGLPRAFALVALLVLANVWLSAGDRETIARVPLALVGATVLTGERGVDPLPNAVVLVDGDGRISAVGDSSTLISDGHDVHDLSGRFLVPGLINAHGHLVMNGGVPGETREMPALFSVPWIGELIFAVMSTYAGERIASAMMIDNAQAALRSGVTTLRGLGDPGFLDVALRDRIAAGEVLGPRLLVAGPILAITGGHAHQIGQVFDGPDEARRAVRANLAGQVDLIKIASTGGVSDSRRLGEAGELQMTPAELEAIVDEAHRKNILVTAHAESEQGVLEALRAGVDNIEHGAELGPEAIALFRDNPNSLRGHTTLHATLSVVAVAREVNDDVRGDRFRYIMTMNGNEIRERMLTGFRQGVAGGVKLGVGTDAGIVDHGSVWMEMKYLVEIGGFSNAEALHIGTLATAESIGVDAFTGSIAPGKFADLVVLPSDPLVDIHAFAEPERVFVAGVPVPLD